MLSITVIDEHILQCAKTENHFMSKGKAESKINIYIYIYMLAIQAIKPNTDSAKSLSQKQMRN